MMTRRARRGRSRLFGLGAWSAVGVGAASVAYLAVARPRLRSWGASADEVAAAQAGDDLVGDRYRTTRAITIRAAPSVVWPWLVQMGYGRGGWYSYDRLERAIGAGAFAEGGSARRVVPELQSLAIGDHVALSPAGGMTVAVFEPASALVLRFEMDMLTGASASSRSRAVMDWTWAFNLMPIHGDADCRLVVRVRADVRPRLLLLALPLLEPVHFVMERRMLHTIKARAEALPGGGA